TVPGPRRFRAPRSSSAPQRYQLLALPGAPVVRESVVAIALPLVVADVKIRMSVLESRCGSGVLPDGRCHRRHAQLMVVPPLGRRVCPVMNEEASEAR